MNKLEKHYIKKMVEEILEIENDALKCTADDFNNPYAVEKFAEEVSNEINFYIDKMIDRNVNQNIIEQLKDLDWNLWKRNISIAKSCRDLYY